MGKAAHLGVSILEGTLRTLFAIFSKIILFAIHIRRKKQHRPLPPVKSNLLLLSATDLAEKIIKREITSEETVTAFIERIKEAHECCNILVDNRFEDAIKEAKEVDEFLKKSDKTEIELPPFFGVPCTIKGSLAVKGLLHTSGLHSRKDVIADVDATVVSLIKKAGAIPIAVTNIPEACCWWETYNNIHGTTSNPYNINHTSGGSSGGESVAISAAGSVIGIGSDVGGSLRIPSAFNGVFGHRPTSSVGCINGHYPIPLIDVQKEHLVTGPVTRYAKDLKPLLKILTSDTGDKLTLDKPVDVKKLKYYYVDEDAVHYLTSPVDLEIKNALRKTAHHFKTLGAHVEKVNLFKLKYAIIYWFAVMKGETFQMGQIVSNNKGDMNFFKELFKAMFGRSLHTFPVILFGLLEGANGIPFKGRLHSAVLNELDKLKQDFNGLLDENAVFLYPTHPTAAPQHNEALARAFDFSYSAVFNVLGFPATQCPVGLNVNGLPLGIQVVAGKHQDHLTIAVAEEIERACGGWVPPF